MTDEVMLKPCPFCGGPATTWNECYDDVWCLFAPVCGCESCCVSFRRFEMWNRRAKEAGE